MTDNINQLHDATSLSRYTAKLWHQNDLVNEQHGNALHKLQTQLLMLIEEAGSGHHGEIIDNESGTVVHRAKYAPIG